MPKIADKVPRQSSSPPSMSRWWLQTTDRAACMWPGCRTAVHYKPGQGRPKYFCHPHHQTAYARERARLVTELAAATEAAERTSTRAERVVSEMKTTSVRWQLARFPELT